jgi:predicted enzyme related to lactoylglutathione lyase
MTSLRAVVYAKDLERVVAFYAGVLALPVVAEEAGEFTTLGDDGMELSVVAMPRAIADAITIDSPPRRREDAAVKVSYEVADLVAARRAAGALGGVLDEREWTWRGTVHCDGHDPEGNVFQLREPSG